MRTPGRPKVDPQKLAEAYELYQTTDLTVKEICFQSGVTRTSLYRYINERKELVGVK